MRIHGRLVAIRRINAIRGKEGMGFCWVVYDILHKEK